MRIFCTFRPCCFAALLLLLLLAGCGGGLSSGAGGSLANNGSSSTGGSTTGGATGSATFTYTWSTFQTLAKSKTRTTSQITSVAITVNSVTKTLITSTSSVTFTSVPVGNQNYTVTAYDQFSALQGTATGTISITNGNTTSVTVAAQLATPTTLAIGFAASNPQVSVGKTLQLTAVAEALDSTGNLDVVLLPAGSFTWTSTPTSIAGVNPSGLVTGVLAGQASITAGYGNLTTSLTVTVGQAAAAQIAFVSTRTSNYQLFLINPDGSGMTQVLSDLFQDNAPSINPAVTSKLAFASYRNNNGTSNWDIYLVNQNGGGLEQLTSLWPNAGFAPAWSPNGSEIAFDVWTSGTTDSTNQGAPLLQTLIGIDLLTVSSSGAPGTRTLLINGGTGACWSPDGTQIAYSDTVNNNCISVINVSTHAVVHLTNPPTGCVDVHPNWSSNGNLIAFERDNITTSGSTTSIVNAYIYTVSPSTSTLSELTSTGQDYQPVWSPDSTTIAFASKRDGGNFELYTMTAAGATPTRLTPDSNLNIPYSW